MAAVETNSIPLGFDAPSFTLLEPLSGKMRSLADLQSDKATVVIFICNHCPFVKHIWDELIRLGQDYMPQGVAFIAINSNDVENYPADHPDKMTELVRATNFPYAYLYDETQEVAKAYDAACTPDFNIFDGAMKCVYRGQLDSSRPGNGQEVNGSDIRTALDAILNNVAIPSPQLPSIGCNIKWKA